MLGDRRRPPDCLTAETGEALTVHVHDGAQLNACAPNEPRHRTLPAETITVRNDDDGVGHGNARRRN